MASFGTAVEARALDMTVEIALKDSVDSFPPVTRISEAQWLWLAIQTFQNGSISRFDC